MKINMIIDGDYFDGKFAPLAIRLERENQAAWIQLMEKETNLALEYRGNPDCQPISDLKKVLWECGFDIYQTIEIMNDEDPEGRLEFENKFNGVTEKTSFSGDAHKNVEIIFMNPDDPDNGNIMLRGKETEFEITGFSSSPSETAESLRKIL
tara:strand:- start:1133 stop:1588 length:456 start_codon:yes stop_codon:yes gene_type:complete